MDVKKTILVDDADVELINEKKDNRNTLWWILFIVIFLLFICIGLSFLVTFTFNDLNIDKNNGRTYKNNLTESIFLIILTITTFSFLIYVLFQINKIDNGFTKLEKIKDKKIKELTDSNLKEVTEIKAANSKELAEIKNINSKAFEGTKLEYITELDQLRNTNAEITKNLTKCSTEKKYFSDQTVKYQEGFKAIQDSFKPFSEYGSPPASTYGGSDRSSGPSAPSRASLASIRTGTTG